MITMPRPTREVVLQPTHEVVRRHAALDPFRGYGNAIRDELPDAVAVLDAFHVVRVGTQVVDEVGYLPLDRAEANMVFQLVSRRYERGTMIITSNKSFAEWGASSATTSSPPPSSTDCCTTAT